MRAGPRIEDRDPLVEDVGGMVHLRTGLPVYAGIHRHPKWYPAHAHSFLEIMLVLGGSGLHECFVGRTLLRRGDALIIPPGIAHSYAQCRDLTVLNCGISRSLLNDELAWVSRDPAMGALVNQDREQVGVSTLRLDTRSLNDCAEPLHHIAGLPYSDHASKADAIAQLLIFFAALARAVGADSREPAPSPPLLVAEAARLLRSDLSRESNLGALSGSLFVTPEHLVRQFRAAMGQPPLAYLSRLRAEAAARLLIASDLPVGVIGAQVGWADASHFSRRFRAEFGIAPRAYRRMHHAGGSLHLAPGRT